jgi:hypothetical protein
MTPWGEALIHPWYQQALAKLTNLPNVEKAAIQTNLSCKLEWVEDCNKERAISVVDNVSSRMGIDRAVCSSMLGTG